MMPTQHKTRLMGNNIVSIQMKIKKEIYGSAQMIRIELFACRHQTILLLFQQRRKSADLRVIFMTVRTGYGSGKRACISTMLAKDSFRLYTNKGRA
jgi:hypothetical protein